jgi:hypothetical protein
MPTLRITGRIDEHHRLFAEVPPSIAIGPVEVVIVLPGSDEDDAGTAWERGVAAQWAEDLADSRQDIYTLSDGEAVDAGR